MHKCAVGVALAILLFIPFSVASDVRAPATLIIDALGYSDYGGGHWVARLNVTFQVSPSDNQTNPALGYTLCGARADITVYICASLNGTLTPIPNRAGWAWTSASFATLDFCAGGLCAEQPPISTWNLTAWTGTTPSVGCSLTIDYRNINSLANNPADTTGQDDPPALLWPYANDGTPTQPSTYNACGVNTTLTGVPGLNAIVESPYGANATQPSLTNVTWRLDPNDPDRLRGNLSYYAFRANTEPPASNLPYRGTLDGPTDGDDAPGFRSANFTSFDAQGVTNPLYVRIAARDPFTHQRSLLSCVVRATEGLQYSQGACGNMPLPHFDAGSGAPEYPGVDDVPALLNAFGLSATWGALVLAAITVLALSGFGYWVGGVLGSGAFGGVGLALSLALFLVPFWIVVALYGACVVAIIAFVPKRGTAQ